MVDDLLKPISEEHPAGDDITISPTWPAINSARRADPIKGRENADWPNIHRLLTEALKNESKDLRLGIWLLEANIKLGGVAGLRDSLRLLRGLINDFWDKGLYPEAEGGDLQYRAQPLDWLGGDNLPRAIRQIPLTARHDGGRNYSFFDYRQSRQIGGEKDLRNSLGDIDPDKEAKRKAALENGGVSVEAFEAALRATRRAGLEAVGAALGEAWEEFQQLDRSLEEKFGEKEAPGTSDSREALEDCRRLVNDLLQRKRKEEPDPAASPGAPGNAAPRSGNPGVIGFEPFVSDSPDGGSWAKAEEYVRSGRIAEGLAEMTRLAAQQYGRARFQQRLRLAEICLGIAREGFAIAILEELAKNIDELQLEKWESPELLGRVWGRLYQCYKPAEPGSEKAARAVTLFDRLCRLDPWQAYRWYQ